MWEMYDSPYCEAVRCRVSQFGETYEGKDWRYREEGNSLSFIFGGGPGIPERDVYIFLKETGLHLL